LARKLVVELVGDSRNLERNLGRATGATKGFEISLKSLARSVGLVFGAATVVHGLEDIIKTAQDAEVATKKMGVAFKNTGLNVKAYTQQIEEAKASGRDLGFTNTETTNSFARLITATGNVKQATKAMGEAQDFARFKNIDLNASTQVITSAMAGNLRAIKQLGIAYIPTATAVDALKAAHKASKTEITANELAMAKLTDKQRNGVAVLDLLNQKIHGQAAAYSTTTSGAMARFRAALDDLEEKIGKKLLPTMTRWANYLADHMPQIEKFIENVAKKAQSLWQVADKVAGVLGGWKGIILGIIGLKFLSMLTGWQGGLKGLIGGPGAGGLLGANKAAGGLRTNLAGLAKLGAIGISIPVWINIGTHFLDDTTKSLVGKLLKYGLPQFIPAALLAKGAQAAASGIFGGNQTMSPSQAKAQFIKEAMANGMTRAEAEAEYKRRQGGTSVNAGGKAGATRGTGGQTRGGVGPAPSVGAPPSVIGYAGKHRQDSRGGHGVTPQQGFDCSGYLVASYRAAGITIPHNTVAMYNLADGQPVPGGYTVHVEPGNVLPGDAVLWNNGQGGAQPGHVGIYAGGGMCWAYSEGSGAPSKTVSMSYLPIMGIRRWVKLRSQVSSGGAGPGGAGTKSAGKTGDPGYSGAGGGGGTTKGKPPKIAPPIFSTVGKQMADDITGATGYVATSLDKLMKLIIAKQAALKAALLKARADVASSFANLASSVMGVVAALGPAFGTAATRALGKKLTDEQKAQTDAQIAAQRKQNEQAIADARASGDQAAIDAAIKAKADYEEQAQIDADAKALAAAQKRDKDNFEKELAALQNEIQKHPERAQKIKAEITKLFAKYGITADSVQAATDWSTAQSLFVGAIGQLVSSLNALTVAMGGKVPGATGGKGGAAGGAAPPPRQTGGRGGRSPDPTEPLVTAINTITTVISGLSKAIGDVGGKFTDIVAKAAQVAGSFGNLAGFLARTLPHAQHGGYLPGEGGIPIMAHGGEYVVRKKAVDKLGVGFLNRLNKYDEGGVVHPWQIDNEPIDPGYLDKLREQERQAKLKYGGKSIFNPRNWTPDIVNTAGKYQTMLTQRYGDLIHFEDGWIPEVFMAVQKQAGLIESALESPPHNIWDRTHGTVWYDLGQGRGRKPAIPSRLGRAAGGVIPSFAMGGVMPHTGLAYVHQGETITPKGAGQVRDINVYIGEKQIAAIIEDKLVERGRQGHAYPARPT
jgi:cell wall-associated NlpC family hydrolase